MRSAFSRDAMTARVSAAFEKWPTFDTLPETKEVLVKQVQVTGDPNNQENYVKALTACCYDSMPVGRSGTAIVGKDTFSDDYDEEVAVPIHDEEARRLVAMDRAKNHSLKTQAGATGVRPTPKK